MESIIGTWRLHTFEVESSDGSVNHPHGKDVRGLLILEQGGYMAEMITGNRRRATSAIDVNLLADAEKIAVATDVSANSGRFELQGGMLLFHIEVSLLPALIGVSQERFYRINGNRLLLWMSPVSLGERSLTAKSVWERIS